MDILYIVGKGRSKCNNLELRYSLRSIAKHGKNIGKVFVAGYCPEWLSGEVTRIPCLNPLWPPTTFGAKNLNIARTTLYALDHSNIGEEFLVSMDDHFYVRDVDFDNYPYYVKRYPGSGENLPNKANTSYKKYLADTRAFLESKGLPILNFCIHRNMHCSRTDIKGCSAYIDEIFRKNINCELWALVNNYRLSTVGLDYTPARDVKLSDVNRWGLVESGTLEVFSTADFRPGDPLESHITAFYPEKSIFEI